MHVCAYVPSIHDIGMLCKTEKEIAGLLRKDMPLSIPPVTDSMLQPARQEKIQFLFSSQEHHQILGTADILSSYTSRRNNKLSKGE